MKNKGWLYIAILTFFVALIWVVVSAIANFRKSTLPADIAEVIKPLPTAFDESVFSSLKE